MTVSVFMMILNRTNCKRADASDDTKVCSVWKNLTDQLTEWWTPVAGFADDQIRTMTEAGYYSISVRPGLRLICMNSNYM